MKSGKTCGIIGERKGAYECLVAIEYSVDILYRNCTFFFENLVGIPNNAKNQTYLDL